MIRSTTLKVKTLTPKARTNAPKAKSPAAKSGHTTPKRRAATAPVKVRTDFVFTAPAAQNVTLAGSFTDWQDGALAMRKLKGGVWKTTVSLPRGSYEYRFIVDGQWQDDPACQARVENSFGAKNCLRVIA